MCGICGIFSKNNLECGQQLVERMCNMIHHRGPDDSGYICLDNIAMGMRRLSIIDLHSGKQPIHNENKTIWIIFNGEIYNYLELREELSNNHKFYTKTDTETILHLYEEYGEDCLTRLNGMFAFAIWDSIKKKLFIARDRLGIKPLYYVHNENKFAFASEIKALQEVDIFNKKVSETALELYFSFLYVPAPYTMFEDVYKLLPGHYLLIEDGDISINQYWDICYKPNYDMNIDDCSFHFLDKFKTSVKRQMISDVPIGVFLSSGIDSSAVTGAMSEISNTPIQTFTLGFRQEERYFDESAGANISAKAFNSIHHNFEVVPDIINRIHKIIWHLDEPVGNSSVLLNDYISEMTSKNVKVALSGMGGDEISAGYDRYLGLFIQRLYQFVPSYLRKSIIKNLVTRLPDSSQGKHFIGRLKRFVDVGELPNNEFYFGLISSFSHDEKNFLFSNNFERNYIDSVSENLFNSYYNHDNIDDLSRMLFLDLKTYLVDDLLTLTDKMSMMHSLEVRVPFLDHDLVEFMATVPSKFKISYFRKKYILKMAFQGFLPDQIMNRKKMGFSLPISVWLRNELQPFITNEISKKNIDRTGYFNWNYVEKLLNTHYSGKQNYSSKIWAILIFILWHRMYIEN